MSPLARTQVWREDRRLRGEPYRKNNNKKISLGGAGVRSWNKHGGSPM